METPGPHPNLQLGRGGRSTAKKGRSPGKGGSASPSPPPTAAPRWLWGDTLTQTASTPPPAAPCDSCPAPRSPGSQQSAPVDTALVGPTRVAAWRGPDPWGEGAGRTRKPGLEGAAYPCCFESTFSTFPESTLQT